MNEVSVISENKFETVDDSYKFEVFSVYEEMFQLISECENYSINDKQSYDQAEELKRKTKKVHIAIKEKGDEVLEKRRIETRDIKSFIVAVYEPIRDAELLLKEKMDTYKKLSKQAYHEGLTTKEKEKKNNVLLDEKLRELNSKLREINEAKDIDTLNEIQSYLNEVNVKDFENKSHEAGFILIQLQSNLTVTKNRFLMNHPNLETEQKDGWDDFIEAKLNAKKNGKASSDLFSSSPELEKETETQETASDGTKKKLQKLSLEESHKLIEDVSQIIFKRFLQVIDEDLTTFIEDKYDVDIFKDIDAYKSLQMKVTKKINEKIGKITL